MNEFIEQFILESRDLVEQGSAALVVLERSPQDGDNLDALFRAFHTLKGGASIVDFTAMERAVHGAEDLLSAPRAGNQAFTAQSITHCQACLDLVARWLDAMERSGELPEGADVQANAFLARIKDADTQSELNAIPTATHSDNWSDVLLKRNPNFRQAAKTAVRFSPRPDSFFRDEDPIALLSSLPELLVVDIERISAWPALDALDPFDCFLVLTALTGSPVNAVRDSLRSHLGDCEIVSVRDTEIADTGQLLSQTAQALLKAQIALIEEVGDPAKRSLAGRIASAGLVAANTLRYCGQHASAALVEDATQKSLAANDPQFLKHQIAHSLTPTPTGEPATPYVQSENALRTIRVNAEQVDALVRLTGELTVVKNAIGHAVKLAQSDGSSLVATLKNQHGVLDHITEELQRAVLGMRVLPLRTVLQRFPRVVRELSSNLGKIVKVSILGDETEADKAIVEMLFEPLLHIVRNSMDHGIEDAKTRTDRNKAPTATISMRALRQGEHVVIEIEDDGGGIDPARVRSVALERGVATPEILADMSDADIVDLIFAPGFSTATEVTELSGRGVGMDAVRTAVGRVGGNVSVESRLGSGTTVRFTLPFSVMMTHVMTVEADGQMFGVPLEAVIETIRVPTETIVGIGAARALVRRDRTIPVFELGSLLRVRNSANPASDATVVIVSFAGQLAGIQVDRLGERMQVMLKPLDGLLAGIPGITGTTILGDGRVLLVLDLEGALQ